MSCSEWGLREASGRPRPASGARGGLFRAPATGWGPGARLAGGQPTPACLRDALARLYELRADELPPGAARDRPLDVVLRHVRGAALEQHHAQPRIHVRIPARQLGGRFDGCFEALLDAGLDQQTVDNHFDGVVLALVDDRI